MSAEPEHLAQAAVAETLVKSPNRAATCAALMRLAGQALARVTSHDQAAAIHAQLARRHAIDATRRHRR
jgi:hypothetical protein